MNKRLLIIFASIGALIIVLVAFMAIAFSNDRLITESNTSSDTPTQSETGGDNDSNDIVTDEEFQNDPSANPTPQEPDYASDPSVISYPVFGSSLTYYTHKALADTTKINLKPEVRDGRAYILMTAKGCKTLSYYFYDNSDQYYNIAERRTAQNVEYVYVEGPVLNSPTKCKPELVALDPQIKEESLFIFRSLR